MFVWRILYGDVVEFKLATVKSDRVYQQEGRGPRSRTTCTVSLQRSRIKNRIKSESVSLAAHAAGMRWSVRVQRYTRAGHSLDLTRPPSDILCKKPKVFSRTWRAF